VLHRVGNVFLDVQEIHRCGGGGGWRRLSCHVKKSVTPINLMSSVKKIYLIEDNSKNLFLFCVLKIKKKESAAFVYWFTTYFHSRMFLIARSATPLLD
jgi:hypothetical protein